MKNAWTSCLAAIVLWHGPGAGAQVAAQTPHGAVFALPDDPGVWRAWSVVGQRVRIDRVGPRGTMGDPVGSVVDVGGGGHPVSGQFVTIHIVGPEELIVIIVGGTGATCSLVMARVQRVDGRWSVRDRAEIRSLRFPDPGDDGKSLTECAFPVAAAVSAWDASSATATVLVELAHLGLIEEASRVILTNGCVVECEVPLRPGLQLGREAVDARVVTGGSALRVAVDPTGATWAGVRLRTQRPLAGDEGRLRLLSRKDGVWKHVPLPLRVGECYGIEPVGEDEIRVASLDEKAGSWHLTERRCRPSRGEVEVVRDEAVRPPQTEGRLEVLWGNDGRWSVWCLGPEGAAERLAE